MCLPASIVWNRKPLPQGLLAPLPPTAIRPGGMLRTHIESESSGTLEGRLLRACLLHDAAAQDAAQAEVSALLLREDLLSDADIRALMRYHAVTADKAAAVSLLRQAKSLRDRLQAGETLPPERAANVGDLLWMALWLYNLTGQRVLLSLCEMLATQAPDWMSTLHIFPQAQAVRTPPPVDTDGYWRVHGPTIAASLKTPALQALFAGGLKNETAFAVGWEKLTRRHGAAHGLFNADPLLSGPNPSRRMDAAIPIEMLRSLETLLWAQGTAAYGDLIEQIVWGPLPAARGAQAANQLQPGEGPAAEGYANAAASLWMASSDEGLAAIGYAPCEVRWRLHGQPVRIEMETAYPAEETVQLCVHVKEETSFPLRLRIPAWAEGATVTVAGESIPCEPGSFAVLARTWRDGDIVHLTLPMAVRTLPGHRQSVSVLRGPVVYALPLAEGEAWNMALLPGRGFEQREAAGIPIVHAYAAPAADWTRSGEAPGELPIAPMVQEETVRQVVLVPYGRTDARIAQFPAGQEP